ncbi:MAG: T9SS type A sorting domain-containing protein [Bacteroidia bacterium]|nr:T9SS type A sorting domain-containing protein [Bacteroidia bacterium]MDW8089462.1 T9SS type A sorting domain-containing protein [Bacteroidia bacterium]
MRWVAYAGLLGSLLRLYAQSGCSNCTASNSLAPRSFDPPLLVLTAGRDTEVVIQFALPETVRVSLEFGGQTFSVDLYPNFAAFVDSLRMKGGTQYVALRGQPNVAVGYNAANPSAGALHFDQAHRYKQVESSPDRYANVVVYQNPGGGSPQNPTPPRGCVRACVRGVNPTPQNQPDTLLIYLRGFVDPATVQFSPLNNPPITATDGDNKDTTNLMPTIQGFSAWRDTWTGYPVEVRAASSSSSLHAALGTLTLSPNPAWGRAELRFDLLYAASVEVEVSTLLGQRVLHHWLGNLRPGSYTVPLALSSGVYLVQLTLDGTLLPPQKLLIVE